MKGELTKSSVIQLIDYFNKILPLDKKEEDLVSTYFIPRLYRKRQYILQEEDYCKQFNFIVSGCLSMYKFDENGSKHIIYFATENWWMIDLGSFHSKNISELNIEALENTIVLQISYDNLVILYEQAPKFNRIFRILIENSYVTLQKRLLYNISSTAEERYKAFQETYPHLINRVSQIQIASFLGITPEFLSRLRKRLKEQ